MPSVQINTPETKTTTSGSIDPAAGVSETRTETYTEAAVHVSWHNAGNDHHGHVQVALECDRSYFEQFPDEPRGSRFSPVLSRSDVNKLILILRRARDQAYGKDA